MAGKQSKSSGKGRKLGEWKAIATSRDRIRNRDIRWTDGRACMPPVTDTGSAAYRRLEKSAVR